MERQNQERELEQQRRQQELEQQRKQQQLEEKRQQELEQQRQREVMEQQRRQQEMEQKKQLEELEQQRQREEFEKQQRQQQKWSAEEKPAGKLNGYHSSSSTLEEQYPAQLENEAPSPNAQEYSIQEGFGRAIYSFRAETESELSFKKV